MAAAEGIDENLKSAEQMESLPIPLLFKGVFQNVTFLVSATADTEGFPEA